MIYFSENLSQHTPLIYLIVSDQDTNENGRVSLELIPWNSHFQLEKMNNETYVLRTNEFFDREERDSFSFTLITYDHGTPRHSIINQFDVHLLDINDCFPMFDQRENYTFFIDENNEENLVLRTINVQDFDLNDRITLQVETNNIEEKNLFAINEDNQLIVRQSLDYETRSLYSFRLIAEDLVGHRTTLPIDLHLNDLNDNPIRFRRNFTRISIPNDLPLGTIFAWIQAKDKDEHDSITYSLQSNLVGLNANGSMFLKQRFDHSIEFFVQANDSRHTDSILIEILVENQSIMKSQSPICLLDHRQSTLQLQSSKNFSFSMRNPSSSGLIFYPNGTLILPMNFQRYSFDVYLQDEDVFIIFENFVILSSNQCSTKFDRQIFWMSFIGLIILSLIVGFYIKFDKKKQDLTHSFSSLFSSPSRKNSSSLSHSSSTSTYLKISRSLDDEELF